MLERIKNLWTAIASTPMNNVFAAKRLACAATLTLTLTVPTFAQQADLVLRVDIVNGTVTGDGSDWDEDAFKFLQDALSKADDHHVSFPNDLIDIWVAAAFDEFDEPIPYRPDQRAANGSSAPCPPYGDCNRTHSFHLRNNVRILGGFVGTETVEGDRDWVLNETILSGDLVEDDEFDLLDVVTEDVVVHLTLDLDGYADNSITVVAAFGSPTTPLNSTAQLDGFTIQGANGVADCRLGVSPCAIEVAAALHIKDATPTIRHCIVQRNLNTETGETNEDSNVAGIRVDNQNLAIDPERRVRLVNCIVRHNKSTKGTSALNLLHPGYIDILDCVFHSNVVATSGRAAVHVKTNCTSDCDEQVTFANCSILNNHGYDDQLAGGLSVGFGGNPECNPSSPPSSLLHVRLWNCLIAENRSEGGPGGGVHLEGPVHVEMVNCTIARNYLGSGNTSASVNVRWCAILDMNNSIVWQNECEDTGCEEGPTNIDTVAIHYSNIENGWSGNGGNNISLSPSFLSGYRLSSNSPSVDAGDNDALPCNEYPEEFGSGDIVVLDCGEWDNLKFPVDLDLNRRIWGCLETIDHGAFENDGPQCPDIDDDGYVGIDDILAMLDYWVTCAVACGCPADINRDGVLDGDDLLLLFEAWGEYDCETDTGGGAQVPKTVADCYEMYFDPEDTALYERCLEMLQLLE